MSILRIQLRRWVDQWNHHRIRPQLNRPYVVNGQLYVNYYWPTEGVQDCGISLPPATLVDLEYEASLFNLDPYLPVETLDWIAGFFLQNPQF